MHGSTRFRIVSAALLASFTAGCLGDVPPPPTAGYGDPYRGTGKPIYVKDSRTDWAIQEGGKPMTSEHALEAVDDKEYLARRETAKQYNNQLYEEGQTHHTRGHILIGSGVVLAVAGAAAAILLPGLLRETTSTPPSATDPETRDIKAGGASSGALIGGLVVVAIGAGLIYYGYSGAITPPPYYAWKTPTALDRPAYVRQQTEPYNEKIGAPSVADQPGSVESLPVAPGQRKPPPPRPETKGGKPAPDAAPAATPTGAPTAVPTNSPPTKKRPPKAPTR